VGRQPFELARKDSLSSWDLHGGKPTPVISNWLVMPFSDDSGDTDMDQVQHYIRKTIPGRGDWEALKSSMVSQGAAVRFLAKIRVSIDVKTGEGLFRLVAAPPATSATRPRA